MSIHYFKLAIEQKIAERTAEILNFQLLSGRQVCWLLSGGSAAAIAVRASKLIDKKHRNWLTIGLIDERYGPPGHSDSNWQHLISHGLDTAGSKTKPVLTGKGFAESAGNYEQFITRLIADKSYILGLLGIGTDGHTAGILPGSPPLNSNQYVLGYEAADFKRITLTPKGLGHLDKAIVYAAAPSKQKALHDLLIDSPAAAQPAQLLKRLPDVEVYNDVIGEML